MKTSRLSIFNPQLVTEELPSAQVTVNAAFLDDIKSVNQELWQGLENIREFCHHGISDAEACRVVVDTFEQLRDLLALHFALEESYGYFDDPAYVDPRVG